MSDARVVLFGAVAALACACAPSRPPAKPAVLPICAAVKRVERAPGCPGKRPVASIQSEFRAHYGEIQECYELHALRHDPRASGLVTSRYQILPDGSIANACIHTSAIDDAEFLTCVVQAVASQEHDASPNDCGVVTVTYPLIFRPE